MNPAYKICVYGICKNEEKFAKRCMDSLKDADLVVMCDTGSTDNTVNILKGCGAHVYSIDVNPWRFDVARNQCLSYIPDDMDICICIDLDEVLRPGWREAIEYTWQPHTNRASYLYIWSFNQDGSPGVEYYHERIHSRHEFTWIYPTHEVLKYTGSDQEHWVFIPDLVFEHNPDSNKSRSFNLPLLELAVKENPDSLRNIHYLGREYYFAGLWDLAIDTLAHYLDHPDSYWKEERSFSMRYIAHSYLEKGSLTESIYWLLRAIAEAPNMREGYVQLAQIAYEQNEWPLLYLMTTSALKITTKSPHHHNEAFAWNETIYDLAALGAFYTGNYQEAFNYAIEALKRAPGHPRLINNLRLIRKKSERLSSN